MATVAEQLLTAEEFARTTDLDGYLTELVRGRIVDIPLPRVSPWRDLRVGSAISSGLSPRREAAVIPSRARASSLVVTPTLSAAPDLSYLRRSATTRRRRATSISPARPI